MPFAPNKPAMKTAGFDAATAYVLTGMATKTTRTTKKT